MTIASALAVFNIEKIGDQEVRFCPGVLSHPDPFKCIIKPRSGVHEEVVREVKERLGYGKSDAEELRGVRWEGV